ncbi:valine--tRNA ligase [Adlercreutzia sp. ZJ242]|uniref:valine--tRNA ligase n=1 Tax=Adlercreutzia sp. ZJ242 TaxID=2709409 RepID=UPI0013ECFE08|nr:valine--tRNA ligase [Adlercreutzia sp. ZJ242]
MADNTQEKKIDYDFAAHERPLFEAWRDAGYFQRTPGFGAHKDDSYTIVIPPPNVTGVLHMGHALNDTIQDACIRRARMRGYQTRWILGTDHAGIATQTKVDKHLAEQGINRREIGREAFIEACQEWRRDYGGRIVSQIAAMGCSCDYADEQFTMSPEFSRAVRQVFCDWYHDGIVYRGKRIVNWCPHCTTAIADDEAEYEDEAGHLWHLRYPLVEPVDGVEYIVVATTRPETMLGDTGVAVNPSDERYKGLVASGAKVRLPLVDREIPVFADFYVDASFGTGCVKVTPAHDPNDFAMGERAGLPKINIFDETAHVVEGFGKFSGMSRDEAREAVVAAFDELGLLDHVEDHDHSVMHCYRCHNTLEPWLSEQWFVAVDGLKRRAAEVVENGQVTFHPERWKQVYLDWLANLKDWCISRQLWWGHQIPMYYCDACGWQDARVDGVDACPECGAEVRQDEDVLDTWFSSQLWPFATQGWADAGMDAPELAAHYPTQVLSTARDIMGLWVARMVMSSMYCTGEIPFKDVIIHPTVMGADGKPMSKSRGNGVDPVKLMEDYGADGMRFGLLLQVTGAQAMRFDYQKIESSRNFANKIRNAARFALMHLDGFEPGEPELVTPADQWIFSRLAALVADVDAAFDAYEFGELTRALYGFVWNEFCDWYIEFSKARLGASADPADRLACQRNLVYVLDQVLRLLHPIMPFVTEELFGQMPGRAEGELLIGAEWPDAEKLARYRDPQAERAIAMVCEVVGSIRSARSRYGISPKVALDVAVKASADDAALLEAQAALVTSLANVSSLEVGEDVAKPAESSVALGAGLEVYTCLAGHVDFEAERARMTREQGKLSKDAAKLEKKLSNPGFLAKAAPEIIEKDRAKLAELNDKLARLAEQIAELG